MVKEPQTLADFQKMPGPAPVVNEASVKDPTVIQAKHYQVATSPEDLEQYLRTIEAYKQANMTFEDIAGAGLYIGNEVHGGQTDAALSEGEELLRVSDGIKSDENGVIAFQRRGEYISFQNQIAGSTTGHELVAPSAVVVQSQPSNQIEVIEGISVVVKRQALESQPNASPVNQIESVQAATATPEQTIEQNPYLKAPAHLD